MDTHIREALKSSSHAVLNGLDFRVSGALPPHFRVEGLGPINFISCRSRTNWVGRT